MSIFKSLFNSQGFKRKIASILAIAIEIAASVPELAPLVIPLQYIAGFFSVTGIAHGAVAQNINQYKLATLASILTALAAIAHFVPQLAPFEDWLRKAAAIVGSIVLGGNLPKKLKDA